MNKNTTNRPTNILVIRLSAMGDVAMTVPVIRCLLQQNSDLKLTVLSRVFFKPFFENIPNLTFIEADFKEQHKGFLGLYKLSKALRKHEFDVVADLHNVLRTKILKVFFKVSGISVFQLDKGRAEKKNLIKGNASSFRQLKTTHERYADVFRRMGFNLDLSKHQAVKKPALNENLQALIGRKNSTLIGIAPFAQYNSKSYSIEKLEIVIEQLSKSDKYTMLFFGGGKEEQAILDTLEKKYKNCINVVGKIAFTEELQLISNLDLMLAMDSGNGHLAAMFGVQTITLWGVTHPFMGFAPFQQELHTLTANRIIYPEIPTSVYGNKFPHGYENAIDSIAPIDVIQKIKSLLPPN
jgi:ADP-heptose:LPS heptosyltransferase